MWGRYLNSLPFLILLLVLAAGLDHDDESSQYNDTDNVLVFGGIKYFDGINRSSTKNLIIMPGLFGAIRGCLSLPVGLSGRNLSGHFSHFVDNTCVQPHDGFPYQCVGSPFYNKTDRCGHVSSFLFCASLYQKTRTSTKTGSGQAQEDLREKEEERVSFPAGLMCGTTLSTGSMPRQWRHTTGATLATAGLGTRPAERGHARTKTSRSGKRMVTMRDQESRRSFRLTGCSQWRA